MAEQDSRKSMTLDTYAHVVVGETRQLMEQAD